MGTREKNKKAIEDLFKERRKSLPSDIDNKLEDREWRENLKVKLLETFRRWKEENCVLCVSRTAKNPAMWAHYASSHQGVVIGIDYDAALASKNGRGPIPMRKVDYPEERQKTDILDRRLEKRIKIFTTKANYWKYEDEMRCIFVKEDIDATGADFKTLQKERLALLKCFKGKRTWFLRLDPLSIREVIFGLRAKERLKSAIRRLMKRLPNAKLFQVKESETYDFDLIELKI